MTSDAPLVSVVTPSYNQGQYIESTIRSVLGQDYPHIEHIVVDGGSNDQTVNILKKYDDKIQWVSERDNGQCDAINKGFRIAQGQIIGWLNSDDLYYDEHVVSRAVDALTKSPDIGLVYGDFVVIGPGGELLHAWPVPDFSASRMRRYHYIPQPSIFFRRSIAEEYPLNVSLNLALDTEWFLRVMQKYQFRRIPYIQAAFREHDQQKTVPQSRRQNEAELAVLRAKYPFEPRWLWYPARLTDKMFAIHRRYVDWRCKGKLKRSGLPYQKFIKSGNI